MPSPEIVSTNGSNGHAPPVPDRAPERATAPDRPRRVVVLGGSFGGSYTARTLERLADPDVEIVVIDRNNYFIFYPLLVEAGTGALQPSHCVVSIRRFLGRSRFIMAEVDGIDFDRRCVNYKIVGEDSKEQICAVEYDHLVIALGCITLQPPVPGLAEHGYELKTLAQAVALRDRAVQLLEQASAIDDVEKRRALLHLIVVGGGYTGVEVAGEYHAYMSEAAEHYPRLDPKDVKITLVDRGDRILKSLDESLSVWSTKHLNNRGIDVRLNTSVKSIDEGTVTLTDGSAIPSYTCVWCAGIQPNPLVKQLGLPTEKHGYIDCDRESRVKGMDRIWAVGDLAYNPNGEGGSFPATAQMAQGLGEAAGANIARALDGKPPRETKITDKGQIAAFGKFDAVAQLFGIKLSGFPAWWLYRTVYLAKIPGFGRKIRVAADWTMDMLTRRDFVELGLHRVVRAARDAGKRADDAKVDGPSPQSPADRRFTDEQETAEREVAGRA